MIRDINDYAYPCMMAEKALKEVHAAMLANQHDRALTHSMQALVECVRMVDAIKYMKEKDNAVRQ